MANLAMLGTGLIGHFYTTSLSGRRRRDRVNDITGHVVNASLEGARFSARLSAAMMHPATGIPLLGGLLVAMYYVLGVLVAGKLVGLSEGVVMKGYWEPFVRWGVAQNIVLETSARR